MREIITSWNAAVVILRVGFVAWLLSRTAISNPAVALFFIAEAVSLGQALVNAYVAKAVDRRPVGMLIGPLYLIAAIVVPDGADPAWLMPALLPFAALEVYLRLSAGTSYTAAGCTWVRLRDRGAFAFVRHPMAASAIAVRLLLLVAFPTLLNAVAAAVSVALLVSHTIIEEGFLLSVPEWRAYALRVPYRFFPKVY